MKFKHTQASQAGTQTLWSCAYCGSIICIPSGRGKPHGDCPSCDRNDWSQVEAPIAMFDKDDGKEAKTP